VDPLDQPGVEAGKVATYALMGRKGYERQREEIAREIATDERYLL
jgi:glucose-6-phosphate isomerase